MSKIIENTGFTTRVWIISFLLILINSYWLIQSEFVRYSGHPTCISLFFNVICILFALVLLNSFFIRFIPKLALSAVELLMIYYMLCISSFIAGHDLMQVLASHLGHAFWFATPENEWQAFHAYLPDWLTVKDKAALVGLYEDKTGFHLNEYAGYMKSWSKVIVAWSAFLTVLVFVMYCINVIIRKQWMDNEKLTYPVIRLPMELINDRGALKFLRQRSFVIGFLIAASINLLNGFSFIYPTIPSIPIKQRNIGQFFTGEPWNAVGWFPISFYPFAVGLGFLIPIDLSFSCWFFYLFYKLLLVIGKATGLATSAASFHPNEQMLGAYMAVLGVALWRCRKYLARIALDLFRKCGMDNHEPMSYRMATLGIVVGSTFIIVFSVKAGMSLWVAILFFALYYIISVAITRLRAELGAPVHDLWSVGSTGPDTMITNIFGTRRFGSGTLSVLSLYYGFNRDYRGHAMPHQLESLKVADTLNLSYRRFGYATIFAAFFGGITSFWAFLHSFYITGFGGGFGWEGFSRLQRWIFYPTSPELTNVYFLGFGAAFTVILMIVRLKFIWFPFHPLGYALAPSWSTNLIWLPLFISWIAKLSVLRYGGLGVLQKATSLFLGLILGEFVVGGFWTLIGIFLGIPTYAFWI